MHIDPELPPPLFQVNLGYPGFHLSFLSTCSGRKSMGISHKGFQVFHPSIKRRASGV